MKVAQEASALDWVRRLFFWLLAWTAIVLIYSFRTNARGIPVPDWGEGFKIAAAQYYVWAALCSLILWIDRRLPIARDALAQRFLWHLPFYVVFAVVFTYVNYYVSLLIGATYDMSLVSGSFGSIVMRSVLRTNSWVYGVFISLVVAFEYHRYVRERDLQTAQLERMLAEARLAMLRAQLHPHFLFNALNTISSLVEQQPRRARQMLERVGELLRLSLQYAEEELIPLEQEIGFVELYLEIQRARYEERLGITVEYDPRLADVPVPTFILQPLVENAIRHGVAPRFEPTLIEVRATEASDGLRLRVRDNGFGLPDTWDADRHSGIGLSNTRERLQRLYGEDGHRFTIRRRLEGGVEVELCLPLKAA